MAALSMKCGICDVQLRSVQEAQEHAELTGHTDFAESTEAVLNLVCRTCGKPCRTKTECELHTKRTGHKDFDDKTSEAAKPILLETKEEDTPTVTNAAENELVVSEVNQQMLEELESMGFPQARAIRALHFSGSTSVEAAINWVVEHENDPDIDEVPMVPSSQKATHHYTPEEAKEKMLELRERARKKKEEEDKRMEREREKERVRIGKELLEAKRTEEENERKRLVLLRKAEKEEEQRAREKIRQKLEEDKAERRRKMGLPAVEDTPKPQATPPAVEEKKSHLPVRPATKAEQMRECLRSLKQNHKDEDARVKKAFQTLLTYIGNIVRSPDEEKFRKIRMSNPSFQERVGSLKGGIRFLELCGFEQGSDEFLMLPREKVNIDILNTAGGELNSAIVNPFFGVL